jgi:hypothetical protein
MRSTRVGIGHGPLTSAALRALPETAAALLVWPLLACPLVFLLNAHPAAVCLFGSVALVAPVALQPSMRGIRSRIGSWSRQLLAAARVAASHAALRIAAAVALAVSRLGDRLPTNQAPTGFEAGPNPPPLTLLVTPLVAAPHGPTVAGVTLAA